MPTISQLPSTAQVTAADEVPLSQSGATVSVSVGALLAATQPAISVPTGSLLGRVSLGPGGPEAIAIGTGLQLASDTLSATAADHAQFPSETTLTPTDQVVLNSDGMPKLLEIAVLRGLFSAGENISIDASGTISAGASAPGVVGAVYSITDLPSASTISADDLVGISQGGIDRAITYANLIDGQTIDQAPAAGPAADGDSFWVGQGGTTLLSQSLSAIWTWIAGKLPGYRLPSVEITTNTTLDPTVHGGHLLVCSQPVTLAPPVGMLGTGFQCQVLNLSGGSVTFGGGILTSSATSTLPSGQAATLWSAAYSAGTVLYASMAGGGVAATVPGQVTELTASAVTATGVTLGWAAPSPPASSYTVQFRVTGTTSWSAEPPVAGNGYVMSGLMPATSYDFVVAGVNSAGTGAASAVLSMTTSSGSNAPGQVLGLAASNPTSTSVALNWAPPTSGGAPTGYTIQYRVAETTTWNTATTGITATSFVIAGLSAATSYDFQVFATNATAAGVPSAIATISTAAASTSLISATWNMLPTGSYVHGIGAIGVNAHVSPATAAVQFGFSTSATTPPATWVVANYVNTDLWGSYVPTPATAGPWYVWVEGTDGSTPTVYSVPFSVT